MKQVYRWFMQDVPTLRMGVARILLGICFFGAYLARLPYIQLLYGAHGFAGLDYYETAGASQRFSSGMGMWLVLIGSDHLIYFLYALILISSFCFMIGFKARYFGLLLFILHIAFDQRNPLATAGWSKLAHSFLLYIILSRAGDILSVDSWWKNRKHARPVPLLFEPAWPMRLLQIHVCTMYFVSSWPRLNQAAWTQGYAVTFALLHGEHSRFSSNLITWNSIFHTMDWTALVLEPFAAAALWIPVLGPIWAAGLCLMHVTLEITTHVDWWNYLMLAGLVTFLPEDWLRTILPKVKA